MFYFTIILISYCGWYSKELAEAAPIGSKFGSRSSNFLQGVSQYQIKVHMALNIIYM